MIDSRPGSMERPVYNPFTGVWEPCPTVAPEDPAILWYVFLRLIARIERDWAPMRDDRSMEGWSAEDVASDIISELLAKWSEERVTVAQVLARSQRRVIDLWRARTRHSHDHEVLGYLVERNQRLARRIAGPAW